MYLLDTNILSAWAKPKANAGVRAWLSGVAEDATYLSVATLVELRYGIDVLPTGKRKRALQAWLTADLRQRFEDRVLPVTPDIAERCGALQALARSRGRALHAMDGLIAATALAHRLRLVTRNTRDFDGYGIELINPWSG
jgi:hypothetical protein